MHLLMTYAHELLRKKKKAKQMMRKTEKYREEEDAASIKSSFYKMLMNAADKYRATCIRIYTYIYARKEILKNITSN